MTFDAQVIERLEKQYFANHLIKLINWAEILLKLIALIAKIVPFVIYLIRTINGMSCVLNYVQLMSLNRH